MNGKRTLLAAALAVALLAPAMVAPAARAQDVVQPITISPLGSYATGQIDAAAAEIVAYHTATQRAYVVNGGNKTLDILDVSDPANPTLASQIDMTQYGGAATSVDVSGDIVAIAVPAAARRRGFSRSGRRVARSGAGRRAARHAHLHNRWALCAHGE